MEPDTVDLVEGRDYTVVEKPTPTRPVRAKRVKTVKSVIHTARREAPGALGAILTSKNPAQTAFFALAGLAWAVINEDDDAEPEE